MYTIPEASRKLKHKVELIGWDKNDHIINRDTIKKVFEFETIEEVRNCIKKHKEEEDPRYVFSKINVTTELSYSFLQELREDVEYVADFNKEIATIPDYHLTAAVPAPPPEVFYGDDDEDDSSWKDDCYGANQCWRCGSPLSSEFSVCDNCGEG